MERKKKKMEGEEGVKRECGFVMAGAATKVRLLLLFVLLATGRNGGG